MKISFLVVLIAAAFSLPAFAEDYSDNGRFGLEGFLTEHGYQAGLVRESASFEIGLDINGSQDDAGASSLDSGSTGQLFAQLRLGLRNSLAGGNYVSYGVLGSADLFSINNGNPDNGSYSLAPYWAVQHHWAGTNLMLNLYVEPLSYTVARSTAGSGKQTATYELFQRGGVGIAYLF